MGERISQTAPAVMIKNGHGKVVCSNVIGEVTIETYEDGYKEVVPLYDDEEVRKFSEYLAEQKRYAEEERKFREYLAEEKRLAEEKAARKLRIPVYPEEDGEERPRKRGKVDLTGYVPAKVAHIVKDGIHHNDAYYRAVEMSDGRFNRIVRERCDRKGRDLERAKARKARRFEQLYGDDLFTAGDAEQVEYDYSRRRLQESAESIR